MPPQPQSTAGLTQVGMGYAPIATGIQHTPRTGFEGVPGLQGFPGMMAQPLVGRAMGQVGLLPLGVGHDQNIYDTLMNLRFTQMQQEAMRHAAQMDRQNFMRTWEGLAARTGTPFGAEQRQAAASLSNAMATAAPMLAQHPFFADLLDQFGGTRGSATVMAMRMMDAGRYRIDPVTGRMGLSDVTGSGIARSIFQDLYGTPGAVAQMQGVSAGQLGGLFQELQMRGMIRAGPSDARGQLAQVFGPRAQDLTAQDVDRLMLDPQVADKLRSFDSERVKRSLKSYTKAVSAMRDIFGDMGRPDAPMHELIAGLEALTMGSMAQIDPGRLSMMARSTYNLAKQAGVTMDNVMVMQQHAAARAEQLGLRPITAVEATQHALAFGGAYRATGQGAFQAWGRMDASQITQLDQNLMQQAAASPVANRLGTAMRLRETVGGFQAGSRAESYTNAIQAGMNEWRDPVSGQMRSINLGDREFMELFGESRNRAGLATGMTEAGMRRMLAQRDTNQEFVTQFGIAGIVRREQGAEVRGFIGRQLETTLMGELQGRGVGGNEARAAAQAISGRAVRRYLEMGAEAFTDRRTRNQRMAEIMEEELRAAGQEGVLQGMNPEQRQQFLNMFAEQFYGQASLALQRSGFKGFEHIQNVEAMANKATLNQTDRARLQDRMTQQAQEALAPLGRGSVLRNAVDALQGVRADDPEGLRKVLGQALGGVPGAEVQQALLKPMQAINVKRQEIERLQREVSNEKDPEKRARLLERLDVAHRELTAQAKGLNELGERFGFAGAGADLDDVRRALRDQADVVIGQQDFVGVKGGFGHEVNQDQIRGAMGRTGTVASRTEAMAVLMARRQETLERLREGKGTADEQAGFSRIVAGIQQGSEQQGVVLPQGRAREIALQRMTDAANDPRLLVPGEVEAEMRSLTVRTEGEARALVRTQRRMLPVQASEAEIKGLMGQGLTEPQARELANARIRAKRLGIDPQEWQAVMRDKGVGEVQAIDEMFTRRARASALTPEQRQRHFAAFWQSEEGAMFRDRVERAGLSVEDIAMKMVATPEAAKHLGKRAVEIHEQLGASQQRLRELARIHTGGDIAKLLAGDLGALPQGEAERIMKEVQGIQQQQTVLLGEADVRGKKAQEMKPEEWEKVKKLQEDALRRKLEEPQPDTKPRALSEEEQVHRAEQMRRLRSEQEKQAAPDGRAQGRDDVQLRLFREGMRDVQLKQAEAQDDSRKVQGVQKITGTLKIVGDEGQLVADWGGSRNFSVPAV